MAYYGFLYSYNGHSSHLCTPVDTQYEMIERSDKDITEKLMISYLKTLVA